MNRWTQQLTETYRQMVLARLVEDGAPGVVGPGQVDLSKTSRENMGGQWRLPSGTTPAQAKEIHKQQMAKRKAEWEEANKEDSANYKKQALGVAAGVAPLGMVGVAAGLASATPELAMLTGPVAFGFGGGLAASLDPSNKKNPFK